MLLRGANKAYWLVEKEGAGRCISGWLTGVFGVLLLLRIPPLGSLFSSLFFVVSLLYPSNVQWKKRIYTFLNDHAQMIGIYGSVLLEVPSLTPICHHPDHKLDKYVDTQYKQLLVL